MKTKKFIDLLARQHLVDAVQRAQEGNSGDIVLLVTHRKVTNALATAHAAFHKLKLDGKTHDTAVLILVAPESRQLAVVGGAEIQRKLPQAWWDEIVQKITASFAREEWSLGLITGIETIGAALTEHFPSVTAVNRSGQSDFIEEN